MVTSSQRMRRRSSSWSGRSFAASLAVFVLLVFVSLFLQLVQQREALPAAHRLQPGQETPQLPRVLLDALAAPVAQLLVVLVEAEAGGDGGPVSERRRDPFFGELGKGRCGHSSLLLGGGSRPIVAQHDPGAG